MSYEDKETLRLEKAEEFQKQQAIKSLNKLFNRCKKDENGVLVWKDEEDVLELYRPFREMRLCRRDRKRYINDWKKSEKEVR